MSKDIQNHLRGIIILEKVQTNAYLNVDTLYIGTYKEVGKEIWGISVLGMSIPRKKDFSYKILKMKYHEKKTEKRVTV